jgi:hypothetical protein
MGFGTGAKARSKAQQVSDSPVLAALARIGLVAYGAVYLLIGWLALQLAWGGGTDKSADLSGALRTLAQQPMGKFLLCSVAVGLVALGLWQASEAVCGYRTRASTVRIRKRFVSGCLAATYGGLGFSATRVALGSATSSSHAERRATTGVLAWPGGRVILVLAALVIIAVGVFELVKGLRRSFSEEVDRSSMAPEFREVVTRLGQAGYVAKGMALGLMGSLLGYATLTFDRQKAPGLAGTLQAILVQPFGRFLLTAMAAGFLAFGLFGMLQARYRRM